MRKTLHHSLYEGGIYQDGGKGFPLVLIHGFPEDGNIFSSQVNDLQEHFRVLVPDLPGSGASPMLAKTSMESMADYVLAILEAEQIGQCVVLGHSMGGYITLALAEKKPEILKGFGFLHSTALEDDEDKKQGRLRSVNFLTSYGTQLFVRQMMPGLFSAHFRNRHPDIVESLVKRSEQMQVESLVAYSKAMMGRRDRTHVLRHSKVPVLFIIGKEDMVIPMHTLLPQIELPPLCFAHFFEKTGHMGMVENRAINWVLHQFLAFCQLYPFS